MDKIKAIRIVTKLAQERVDDSYEGGELLDAKVKAWIAEQEQAVAIVGRLGQSWYKKILNKVLTNKTD